MASPLRCMNFTLYEGITYTDNHITIKYLNTKIMTIYVIVPLSCSYFKYLNMPIGKSL